MLLLTVLSTACWPACFWWMWRISKKQNELLRQLRAQAHRIEQISRAEHDMIKETHPQISEIKETVQQLASTDEKRQRRNGGG